MPMSTPEEISNKRNKTALLEALRHSTDGKKVLLQLTKSPVEAE